MPPSTTVRLRGDEGAERRATPHRPRRRSGATAPVVVVGGGVAGTTAAFSLRNFGYEGRLILVSDDCARPYRRSPLSKEYLRDEITRDELVIAGAAAYREAGIDLLLGARATALDTARRTVAVRGHGLLHYDRLILASGARAGAKPVPEGIFTVEDVARADALRASTAGSRHAVVVGAGYTGSEVASSLAALGLDVTLVGRSPYPVPELGAGVGRWLSEQARASRIHLRLVTEAVAIKGGEGFAAVRTAGGELIEADFAVLTQGLEGETARARHGDLTTAAGTVTNGYGQTADERVFAAGDAARVRQSLVGAPVSLGHEDAAREMGQVVAASLLGLPASPVGPPTFATRVFGVTIDVVGLPALGEYVGDADASAARAIWTYERAGRVVAAAGVDAHAELAEIREQIGRPGGRELPGGPGTHDKIGTHSYSGVEHFSRTA